MSIKTALIFAVFIALIGYCDGAKSQVVHFLSSTGVPTAVSPPNPLPTTPGAGNSTPTLKSALSTTVQTISSIAATLDDYFCANPNSTFAYIQIFDVSGTVTLGSTVPKWSIGIPPTSSGNLSRMNLQFQNAIKVAATTTAGGSTALTTAVDCNFGSH